MGDYLGFGKETVAGAPYAPQKTWPVLTAQEEMCEDCGAIRSRVVMEFAGSTEAGEALYRCVFGGCHHRVSE